MDFKILKLKDFQNFILGKCENVKMENKFDFCNFSGEKCAKFFFFFFILISLI